MYTLGALLLLALVLSSVTTLVDSILGTVGLAGVIKKLPIIGANWNLIVSILLVWVLNELGGDIALAWWNTSGWDTWLHVVVTGAIVYGMVPVKDAVISMVGKGLRA